MSRPYCAQLSFEMKEKNECSKKLTTQAKKQTAHGLGYWKRLQAFDVGL